MDAVLCTLGHVASVHEITARGVTPAQLRGAVASGAMVRLRRGVYGCPHLNSQLALAAAAGGAVTCVSVLRAHGVWAGQAGGLHLQVPRTSSARPAAGIHLHWATPRFGLHTPWQATRLQALWQAIHCLDEENSIAALESAVASGFLPEPMVRRLTMGAPRALHDGIGLMTPGSGSGNETIVRLRLQRAGYRVTVQGAVPGLGRQDLVVDDCLGLEVDGREWHVGDQFAIDRDRDVQAQGLGRRTLRLRAAHIYGSWPTTLAVIDRAVMDARGPRDRRERVVVAAGDPL